MLELKGAGIDPEIVHFISYGVKYGTNGVIEDYTIFSGDDLMTQCQHYMDTNSVGIPKCTLPNVHGFLSAMTHGIYLRKYPQIS